MHAAVRHLVRSSPRYDPEWGTPVNQEDLAGTLMTFSIVVLDALEQARHELQTPRTPTPTSTPGTASGTSSASTGG